MSGFNFWQTEITYLKKVGPKRAEVLQSEAGIHTFGDLLHYFPFKYVDKSHVTKVREIRSGMTSVTLIGRILQFKTIPGKRGKRLEATFSDGTGMIKLMWFKGVSWIKDTLNTKDEIVLFGTPKFTKSGIQIAHPEIEKRKAEEEMTHTLKIVPHYSSTEKLGKAGLDSKGIRTLIHSLLEAGSNDLIEILSPRIIADFKLMGRKAAIINLHFPEDNRSLAAARRRMIFEEFFFFQLMLAQKRLISQPQNLSFPFEKVGHRLHKFYDDHIPFELTGAQKRVIKEIRRDLGRNYQMNRLVQGDVGSGKTMVAFMTCLIALDNGFQCALMAPTEILAEQHYRNFKKYSDSLGITIALIVGGQKKSEREQLLRETREGIADIVVGTHALIEPTVEFKKLGLAIVDEQHKFGVKQRAALWQKGAGSRFPHNLVMTATPIPRTLGLTLYGDLDVSVIDELPPGRTPVRTAVRTEAKRKEVFGFIKEELKKGRQAYIVYPLVEESEKLDYLAVTEGFEAVHRYFPEYRIGIVHGRQKSAAKDMEMSRFKNGEFKILVATTVIEVGVDVPNATIMVIENSEKFGLSQLHQLRGRVGRGGNQSYCILMVGKKTSEDAKKRLQAMVATHDGFKISEYDLKLRGPGDFLGTRQSGLPEFRIANIIEDGEVLNQSRQAAFDLVTRDPNLLHQENRALKIYFEHYCLKQLAELGVT